MGALRRSIRVGVRCDAGPTTGVGHLVRCIALAEELRSRGTEVLLLGDAGGLPWAEQQLAVRGLVMHPVPDHPAELAEVATAAALDAVVLDGYHLPAGLGATLRRSGIPVLALVDGPFGADQEADLYLDQNFGAAGRQAQWPADAQVLTGVRYALLRDAVRTRRPAREPNGPPPRSAGSPTKVLAVFGGTDPYRASLVLAPLLLATGAPLALTVVATAPEVVHAVQRLPLGAGQELSVRPPVDDLPALVLRADLVLSAAGTSMWELCCLGAATALVCVTDNQESGYRAITSERLAAPVGVLGDLTGDAVARRAAVEVLSQLCTDPASRTALAVRAWRLVDGHGRERVADALYRAMPGSQPGR